MGKEVQIQLIAGVEATPIVDPFYEQEGKTHRARESDLFFVAVLEGDIVGVCRFCIEEETPLLRSMIVYSKLRSHKIGTQILKRFAEYLDERGIESTYCIPYDHLGSFYGQIGFEIVNEEAAPLFLQERIRTYRQNNPDKFMIMRRTN